LNFELTEEQRLTGDVIDRVIDERYGFEAHRAAVISRTGWSKAFWQELGVLGILGGALPKEVGGLGGGAFTTFQVMKAFGRKHVISPYLSTVVCAAQLIARVGNSAQQAELLPRILSGEQVIAFACAEIADDGGVGRIATTAFPEGTSYRINGRKTLVTAAAWADKIIVVARVPGEMSNPQEFACFIVSPDAAGMTLQTRRTIDGGSASEILFDDVLVGADALIGPAGGSRTEIERIIDEAAAALCAEAAGIIDAMLEATVEYAKIRVQFGQPIGKFQVLQHRMVDMLIARDQTRAAAHLASICLDGEAPARRLSVSAAKNFVGRAGRRTAQAAVQIHGGVGTTEGLALTHHFRRLEVIDLLFGSPDDHLVRYADLLRSDLCPETSLQCGDRLLKESNARVSAPR
jgi:alkylation response protein AidB-like acyl-CoA dehydrogenase